MPELLCWLEPYSPNLGPGVHQWPALARKAMSSRLGLSRDHIFIKFKVDKRSYFEAQVYWWSCLQGQGYLKVKCLR